MKKTKNPAGLGLSGKRLYKWISQRYEIEGVEPMILEICTLRDRLDAVRAAISQHGVCDQEGKKSGLLDAENKLSASFCRAWRLAGLSDRGNQPMTRAEIERLSH